MGIIALVAAPPDPLRYVYVVAVIKMEIYGEYGAIADAAFLVAVTTSPIQAQSHREYCQRGLRI